MLSRSITFRLSLRIAAILLLIWALYLIFQISLQPAYAGDSYVGPLIQSSFLEAIWSIFFEGAFLLAAAAVLLLGFSSKHPGVTYWSIQVAVWFVGISLWYKFNQTFDPLPQSPLWLIVTAICSLALFALYKPITYRIRKLVMPNTRLPSPKL